MPHLFDDALQIVTIHSEQVCFNRIIFEKAGVEFMGFGL